MRARDPPGRTSQQHATTMLANAEPRARPEKHFQVQRCAAANCRRTMRGKNSRHRTRSALTAALLVASLVTPVATACAASEGSTELRSEANREFASSRAAHYGAEAIAELGTSLYQVVGDAQAGNILISPTLAAQQLGLLRLAAQGMSATVLDELLDISGYDDLQPVASADVVIGARTGEKRNDQRRGTLSVDHAVSLWLQRGTEVSPNYVDDLQKYFGIGLHMVDFRSDPEAAREAVNAWAQSATDDRLERILDRGRITQDTRLLTAGTLWMEAPWATPFDAEATRDQAFRLEDGQEIQVPTMRLMATGHLRYGEGDTWKAVEIPYLGGELSMLVILPVRTELAELENRLDGQMLEDIRHSLTDQPIDLHIPRFAFSSEVSLQPAISVLGGQSLFSLASAQLDGMAPGEVLALADVAQRLYFAIDEDGTEGSAATLTRPTTLPTTGVADMSVDRPFLFAVTDRPSGLLLALGRVSDPSA